MKTKHLINLIFSSLLIAVMMISTFPSISVNAAQSSEYTDPADNWLKANGRTNELDMNATTTYETGYCTVCERDTLGITYRVPEYTKSGETALNRGVKYSDGTLIDGEGTGNLDDGTPGVDAFFTGYHWTKSVCQTCGTMNSIEGPDIYNFNKNVYSLYSCDNNFFVDFDNTTYEPYNDTYHTTTLKKGKYCQFCKGTQARASESQERHNFAETVDAQIGNNRFYVAENCEDCDYETSEYVTAKSVVASYYGAADGKAHTVTVSDLSDSGVHTSIRYGKSAGNCNQTSAPNYTEAGYYPVYYEIDYEYDGENMIENGVSYVWLLEENNAGDNSGNDGSANTPHVHDYRYVETVPPSCTDLGFERWQCDGCGRLEKRNYTPATGHDYEDVTIREATCKQGGLVLTMCKNCGDFHETTTPTGEHKYQTTVHNPTCREVGYTEHTCEVCGDNYITDITPLIAHAYERITKEPTCTEQGYTTSTCTMCGSSYVSDYTDPTGHSWDEGTEVTSPTCTGEGVIKYHCQNQGCNEKMIKAESATGHTPGAAATCTQPQVCEKCGTVLELPKGHSYETEVIAPTCAAMGYTTYICETCGDTYKDNYTDKLPHDYETVVTERTCTEHGFTTYTCKVCGDTYTSDYTEAAGHKPSEWIVDVPATIESAGSKHIECLTCGMVLQTVEIPQLVDTDHSDEDGDAVVGDYSIILTDESGKPVFDSEITIDKDDNVTIKLPDGRLLDYADRTTITVFYTDTQAPKEGLQIFIYDSNNNAATGVTDTNGQLVVPNNQSSTGDDNGTIGTDDGEQKKTFVVTVTDKTNVVIPDCDIYIGESNNLVVDLPEGVKPTSEYPVIITVTDQNGSAQKGVTVIALGDADYVEKDITDIYGKVTLPITNEGYTDENGKVNVSGINVIVNDELGFIQNAYVVYNEDGSIAVTLPEDKAISHANRITVTVLDSVGNPIAENPVMVTDIAGASYTGMTDETGKMVVPPLSEDYTDSEGKAQVNGYNVIVTDESKPIENTFITILDGKLNVKLPEGCLIAIENRITVTVTDSENAPVKDMPVTVVDNTEKSESNLTDENGKATVPPTNIDYTDVNGYAEVDGYAVTVQNETGFVEKAFVTLNTTQSEPDENGNITESESISVQLPENVKVDDYANRVIVTVLHKADNTPVSGMPITITEAAAQTEQPEEKPDVTEPEESLAPTAEPEATETPESTEESEQPEPPKSANGITDKDGKVTVPPLDEDMTDDNGDGDIIEINPGEDTDGDGKPDSEDKETSYTIDVSDTKGSIPSALIKIKDGKITVTLPDTHTLTTSNQTTVTVKDKDGNPVKGVSVTIKDKTTSKSGTTNASGQVTLPVKSSGGGSTGGGGGSSSGGGGGWSSSYNTINVKVTDKDGKTVSVSKSTGTDKVTLTLPTGKTLEDGNWYTVTVTDRNGKAKADYTVILKDREKNEVTGKTDKDGVIILPAVEHKAYIVGYEDGTFRPDSDMTRAEAAAIFARMVSEEKDEKISGNHSFTDVSENAWYADYIGYLAKYDIIKGYEDGTFRPDAPVTRAEFTAMTVRYYDLFHDVKYPANTTKYPDVGGSYWAVKDISFATSEKWLNGYADGSFKPDTNITRAEVVTVVNRATGRTADKEYINDNLSTLEKFTDMKDNKAWFFYNVMEAANTHMAVTSTGSEIWAK